MYESMVSELRSPDHLLEAYGRGWPGSYREENGHSLNPSSTSLAAIANNQRAPQREARQFMRTSKMLRAMHYAMNRHRSGIYVSVNTSWTGTGKRPSVRNRGHAGSSRCCVSLLSDDVRAAQGTQAKCLLLVTYRISVSALAIWHQSRIITIEILGLDGL